MDFAVKTHEEIPYRTVPHPVTQLTNGQLAMWLFIASEVMLFGGLYFVYFACRPGVESWAVDKTTLSQKEGLLIFGLLGVVNILCTILAKTASNKTIFFARSHQREAATLRDRVLFLFSVFVISQCLMLKAFHGLDFFQRGLVPAKSLFFSLYYVFCGLHFLHMLGGFFGLLFFAFQRFFFKEQMKIFLMYWTLVDLLWVAIFLSFYW